MLRPSLFTLGFLLAGVARLSGQSILLGLVREDSTRRLLAGVQVVVEGGSQSAVTDKAGEYAIAGLHAGVTTVLFRAIGFRPIRMMITLENKAVSRLDAMLVPLAVRIDPLVVAAEVKQPHGMGREAFEERRRLGFGQFIDSLELRRSEDRRLSDLLRSHNGIVMEQGRFAKSSHTGCYMQIIYDGQTAYSPATFAPQAMAASPAPANSRSARLNTRAPAAPTPLDINTFTVSGLEAIEMYRSLSDTPLQFGGAAAGCGTLVFWSRRGGLPPKP